MAYGRAPVDGAESVQVQTADGIHYAGHTEPGSRLATPGAAEWPVVWTAPTAGPVTFSAAANATDDDRSPLGDYVYALERAARMP
jgi:hypothetical protein